MTEELRRWLRVAAAQADAELEESAWLGVPSAIEEDRSSLDLTASKDKKPSRGVALIHELIKLLTLMVVITDKIFVEPVP